ncbi:hypothetical protein FJ651_03110 [Paucihalobacter ruber]|uniref:T9SS C-terminal target domain-containing protein n=1 Tax=Paucihalobacter ruber TaxID=2567861 RepID=A0A506PRN4_9FLAO|nr:hypothetical protein [Paucihalobacter ruber]TPV35922.1 hypothetical protein FJ651_03110 [Paucihalobacter ruber]
MKTIKNFFFFLTVSLFAFNCSSDDDNNDNGGGGGGGTDPQLVQKFGAITTNERWTADNIYVLNGKVVVDEGVTLTIDAGTIIKGAQGQGSLASALVVDQGGKVEANGTAQAPIIMTSTLDQIQPGQINSPNLTINDTGLWGGLIILGRAPISVSGDVEQAQIEGIPATDPFGQYGGTIANDNSGIYRYISVRHGGITIGNDNEINGITMGGVGSQTIMENLEVVANQDDGFEWFGGTVNGSNLITYGHGDDGFDADQAWSGTVTNGLVIQTAESGSALELDGPEGSAATEAGYTFNNITLIGAPSTNAFIADCRDGLIVNLNNVLVYNFGAGSKVRISGADSQTELANDRIAFSNWQVVLPNGVAIGDLITGALPGDEVKFTNNASSIANSGAATVGANVSVFNAWTFADVNGAF